jgi:hypothetical protein
MAAPPPATAKGTRKGRPIWVAILIGVAVLAGVAGYLNHAAKVRKADKQEDARQIREAPQIAQQRAVAEARATLNIELLPDDGTFSPATGEIEVGSLLYTVHLVGPDKQRYYSEDAYLVGREGDRFVVRPILDKPRPGAPTPQNYRNQQSRSAETKREEVKAQKKITREELAEKYAARTGR